MAQEYQKIKNPRENDLKTWLGVKLKLPLTKKLKGEINQELRLKSELQEISSFFTDFSLEYNLPHKWEVTGGFRYGYPPTNKYFYRIYSDLTRDFKNIGRFDIDWRFRVLHEWNSEEKKESLVRNKVQTTYNFRKSKFNASLGFEIFNSLNANPGFLQFTAHRTTLSVDRELGKRAKIEVFIGLDRSINSAPAESDILTGATLSLSPKFKKKKKKKEEE